MVGMLERYVETLITGEHDENNSIREDIIKRFHEETLPGMKNGRTQEQALASQINIKATDLVLVYCEKWSR